MHGRSEACVGHAFDELFVGGQHLVAHGAGVVVVGDDPCQRQLGLGETIKAAPRRRSGGIQRAADPGETAATVELREPPPLRLDLAPCQCDLGGEAP